MTPRGWVWHVLAELLIECWDIVTLASSQAPSTTLHPHVIIQRRHHRSVCTTLRCIGVGWLQHDIRAPDADLQPALFTEKIGERINSNLFFRFRKQGEKKKQVFSGILGWWNSFCFMHDPQEFQPGENTKMWREDVFHGMAGKLWNGSTFVWRGTDTLQRASLKRAHYTGGGRWRQECEWGLMGIIWRWKTNGAAGRKPPAVHARWLCGLFCWRELQPLRDLTLFM